MNRTSHAVWSIALPAALTNMATALFGIADIWVIGRLGDPAAQGAVELGAKFMMGLLVSFNFLRTSTIALTAQATGSGETDAQAETLARALAVAVGIGLVLLAGMPWAVPAGLGWLGATGALAAPAHDYVAIRYWAGPAWLVNAALTGWLIGQRRVKSVLAVEVVSNLAHIALDVLFVLGLHLGVSGVAAATVLSELVKLALLAAIAARHAAARHVLSRFATRSTWQADALGRLFALNRDLFVRTILLTGAMLVFARAGANQGAVVLAANGILFQLFMVATMLLDGFENAAQVLCGEAKGSRARVRFVAATRAALLWGGVAGIACAAVFAIAGSALSATFSTDSAVRLAASQHVGWIVALSLVGFASFVLDGVFVGAGWTRAMLGTMAVAMAAFLALLWVLAPWGNHGLWLAYTGFLVIRAAGQFAVLPALVRREFAAINRNRSV